jgi:hypothetical protein
VLARPGHPAAIWFQTEARAWRNALAHGRLQRVDDDAPVDHLTAVARAALPRALMLWLADGDPKKRPARLLIQDLSNGVRSRPVVQ